MSQRQQHNIFSICISCPLHLHLDSFLLLRLPSIMVGPILVHCFLERLQREF